MRPSSTLRFSDQTRSATHFSTMMPSKGDHLKCVDVVRALESIANCLTRLGLDQVDVLAPIDDLSTATTTNIDG